MTWFFIAVVAYFIFALTAVADKFLLSKVERHPAVYTFFTGLSGPIVLVLLPFGFKFLPFNFVLVGLVSGICEGIGFYFLYSAIKETSVSRALPVEGGLFPLVTLVLSYFILSEKLSPFQLLAFVFLVVGAIMISFRKEHGSWHFKAFKNTFFAASFFALSFVLRKYVYETSFITGLIWLQLGFFLLAISFLVHPAVRRHIFHAPKQTSSQNKFLFFSTKAVGGVGGFLQNYAVSLGSVSLVSALQGVQFIFIFLLTSLLSLFFPKILKERLSNFTIWQKISAICLVAIGLFILSSHLF